ncbi:biotin transporter BioY [Candidatus Nanopelagicales bacterium]|nr:biotin transporter BioY [Candidatus Nanopelagicales bacterium]
MSVSSTEHVLADVVPATPIRNVLLVIAGAGLVGLSAQLSFSIPLLSPTAFTLQAITVLAVAAALGAVRGMAAMTLYAGLALLGLPWLTGGSSAFNVDGQLVASFGYSVGFIAAAGAVGFLAQRGWTRSFVDTALAMVLGSAIIYGFGVVWLQSALGISWSSAIYTGMSVFLLADAIKVLIVSALFPIAWRQLAKADLLQQVDQTTATEKDAEAEDVGTAEQVASAPRPREATYAKATASAATVPNSGDEDSVIDLTDENDASLSPVADKESR